MGLKMTTTTCPDQPQPQQKYTLTVSYQNWHDLYEKLIPKYKHAFIFHKSQVIAEVTGSRFDYAKVHFVKPSFRYITVEFSSEQDALLFKLTYL